MVRFLRVVVRNVVRVLECDSCFSVWLVLLECSSCAIECTVRLYDTPPFVIASSSAGTREFELEYSRVRVRVRVLASSRASVHTRNLTHACALLSLACLALARLQYSRVALRVTRVARTRLLTCG